LFKKQDDQMDAGSSKNGMSKTELNLMKDVNALTRANLALQSGAKQVNKELHQEISNGDRLNKELRLLHFLIWQQSPTDFDETLAKATNALKLHDKLRQGDRS